MTRAPKVPAQYTETDFVRLALEAFPELREEFEYDEGLLHLQMHAFQRLTGRAIKGADWETFRRCVHLATELWERADPALENALNVSLLEHLEFEGSNGREAWGRMTTALKRGWEEMDAYNKELAARSAPRAKTKPSPADRRGKRR